MLRPTRPRPTGMSRFVLAARESMSPTPPEEGSSRVRPSGGGKSLFWGRSQTQKAAALPPPGTKKPPPPPPVPPRQWTVLFNSPTPGQSEVSRRPRIQIFFNRPVEREVTEWAFTISPSTPGGFAWPRPDHLVFTPRGALQPDTEYTLSITPVDMSRAKEPFAPLG